MKTRILLVAALVVLLSPMVTLAQAQPGDVPSFDAFLQGLSGPLVSAAVAILLSIIVEYWPKFETLAPRYKRLIYFGLCLVVPVGAATLRGALGYVAWSFDPLIWHAIWAGFGAGGVGTVLHSRKLPS